MRHDDDLKWDKYTTKIIFIVINKSEWSLFAQTTALGSRNKPTFREPSRFSSPENQMFAKPRNPYDKDQDSSRNVGFLSIWRSWLPKKTIRISRRQSSRLCMN